MGLFPATSGGTSTPIQVDAFAFGQMDGSTFGTFTASANRVYWNPITIPFDYNISRFVCTNGTSTTTRSLNIGIYTTDGTRMYETGDTSLTTPANSALLYVTPNSPVLLPAGTYFLAFRSTSSTSYLGYNYSSDPDANFDGHFLVQSSSTGALPATMASAQRSSSPYAPIVALNRT
jgi:hypothetical protein